MSEAMSAGAAVIFQETYETVQSAVARLREYGVCREEARLLAPMGAWTRLRYTQNV